MSNRNILQALQSAGGAGGAFLDVDDVFSTHLYTGNSSTQTITNNIDLSGEGGLVWTKTRSVADNHRLTDTARGVNKGLDSSNTYAEFTVTGANGVSQFNNNGFVSDMSSSFFNNQTIATWTFRKAPKFFDILTWTGNGVNGRTINHSLDSLLGMITIKCTSTSGTNWATWHRGSSGSAIWLNSSNANSVNGGGQTASGFVYNPSTSTTSFSVDNGVNVNQSGLTYTAYLWAHNNNDGEFGPDSDQDIIKCGSYTGNESSPPEINLGFEPQWVMIKRATDVENWAIFDNMRGVATGGNDSMLRASTSEVEYSAANQIEFTSTGFKLTTAGLNISNTTGTYIYMAIRRGPLAVPTSASDVFAVEYHDATVAPGFKSQFPVDFALINNVTAPTSFEAASRLTQGKSLSTASTAVETNDASFLFDYQDGWRNTTGTFTNLYSWMWKRAPGYFDVVCYTGNGNDPDTRSLTHNLGVTPEMCWIKCRSTTEKWMVWHKDLTQFASGGKTYGNSLTLNDTTAVDGTGIINVSDTNATTLKLGFRSSNNTSGQEYIAYLFATAPGVSKVGSYTGTNSTLNVDCGFSSGARFVLIRRIDAADSWILHDSARGIVAGNDPYLLINTTLAQITGYDPIDPLSSGFTVNGGGFNSWNASGGSYIFYAIA